MSQNILQTDQIANGTGVLLSTILPALVANVTTGNASNIIVTGNGTGNITIDTRLVSSGGGGGSSNIIYATGSTGVFYLVGVATVNANSTALCSTSVYVQSNNQMVAGDYAATSDATLKDVTRTIPDALNKVLQLNGVEFTWNNLAESLGIFNQDPQVGVLAQDVQVVLPEAVSVGHFRKLVVSYDKLIPLLIEAIKELNAKLEER